MGKTLFSRNPRMTDDGSFISRVYNPTEKPYTLLASYQVGAVCGGGWADEIIVPPHGGAVVCSRMSRVERMAEWVVLTKAEFLADGRPTWWWWYEVTPEGLVLVASPPIVLQEKSAEGFAAEIPWFHTLLETPDVWEESLASFLEAIQEYKEFSSVYFREKWYTQEGDTRYRALDEAWRNGLEPMAKAFLVHLVKVTKMSDGQQTVVFLIQGKEVYYHLNQRFGGNFMRELDALGLPGSNIQCFIGSLLKEFRL